VAPFFAYPADLKWYAIVDVVDLKRVCVIVQRLFAEETNS